MAVWVDAATALNCLERQGAALALLRLYGIDPLRVCRHGISPEGYFEFTGGVDEETGLRNVRRREWPVGFPVSVLTEVLFG